MKKVQWVQTNTMKGLAGKYNCSLKKLLMHTNWLSVYQMSIYHSLILCWKVQSYGKPERLVRRISISEDTTARLLLSERVWSRTAERHFKLVENMCVGITEI